MYRPWRYIWVNGRLGKVPDFSDSNACELSQFARMYIYIYTHLYIRTNPTREPIFVSGTYSTKPFAWATLQLGIQYAWRPHVKGMNQSLIDNLKRKPTFHWTKLPGHQSVEVPGATPIMFPVPELRVKAPAAALHVVLGGGSKKKSSAAATMGVWSWRNPSVGELFLFWKKIRPFLKMDRFFGWFANSEVVQQNKLTDKLKGFEPGTLELGN